MTPDELARVPEGGAKWKLIHPDSSTVLLMIGDGSVYRVLKPDARQIVGSVNSTIISNMIRAEPSLRNMLELDKDRHFWLDYARGGAHD